MRFEVGDLVTVVSNASGKRTAPYKRLKQGVENVYVVSYVNPYNGGVECRWKNNGRLTSAYHWLDKADIVPLAFFNLKEEDFL